MKMKLLILLFCIWLTACSSTGYIAGDQAPSSVKKRLPNAKNPNDCREKHGAWMRVSNTTVFPDGGYCEFKATDGGKVCNSSSECQGYCELSIDNFQGQDTPRCSTHIPPRWERCVPGYFENGKVLGRGECFGDDSEVQ